MPSCAMDSVALEREHFVIANHSNPSPSRPLYEGVQAIGTALGLCSTLSHINIPSTVTAIDEAAFAGCRSLEEIQLNEGLLSIGSFAFPFTSLKHVRIPSTVTTLDKKSFAHCSSLMVVQFCEGPASTGEYSIFYEFFYRSFRSYSNYHARNCFCRYSLYRPGSI